MPPSAKALNWFCSQPESSAVYPLFFISKDTENPSLKSLYVNETRGVFGIGAAVYYTPSSFSSSSSRIKRFVYVPLLCCILFYIISTTIFIIESLHFVMCAMLKIYACFFLSDIYQMNQPL